MLSAGSGYSRAPFRLCLLFPSVVSLTFALAMSVPLLSACKPSMSLFLFPRVQFELVFSASLLPQNRFRIKRSIASMTESFHFVWMQACSLCCTKRTDRTFTDALQRKGIVIRTNNAHTHKWTKDRAHMATDHAGTATTSRRR
jgi:hypothetical protein